MPSNYPTIAGDYVAKINQNRLAAATSGTINSITLTTELPPEIVLSVNGPYPVYARLGCRIKGVFEHVQIEKGSYKSQDKTLRIIRGQSPFAACTGGEAFAHTASAPNSLELNFGIINPCSYQNIIEDLDSLQNNIASYISNNIAGASTIQKGLVTVSYYNPAKPVNEPYSALTNDNPLIKQFFAQVLNLPTNSPQLNFDQGPDSQTLNRLQTLNQIFSYFYNNPTKVTAFISFLNTL